MCMYSTRHHFEGLAHTKELRFGLKTSNIQEHAHLRINTGSLDPRTLFKTYTSKYQDTNVGCPRYGKLRNEPQGKTAGSSRSGVLSVLGTRYRRLKDI